MNTSVVFQTLGCKLNQLESESIAASFKKAGFTITNKFITDNPCLFFVNTCTVTSKSEQKARRIIRAILRNNPFCPVIVTGCYAQLNKTDLEKLESIPPNTERRLFVVPGNEKNILSALPEFMSLHINSMSAAACVNAFLKSSEHQAVPFSFDLDSFTFHSRAFLKIQDGCNNCCTFCRVHIARGNSVSLDAEIVLQRLRELENADFEEAVLSGVNITQYESKNLNKSNINLSGLLTYLLEGTKKIALRLSSIEPDFFTPDFFSVAAHPRIRPHFHLSVQSFSNDILHSMGRKYTAQNVMDAVNSLRTIKDDPFLACDIITGFPGESDLDFEKTFDGCKKIDFAWIHSFPYSKRPGTQAFDFKNRIQEKISFERTEKLLKLASLSKTRYIQRWVGKEIDAISLCESKQSGLQECLSANYLRLSPEKNKTGFPVQGKAFRCRITALNDDSAYPRIDAFCIPLTFSKESKCAEHFYN
ncbi:MAG: tRNA (N(6)-L-threonylcarbamoyladenosine(37)-C(2))-methylthiotransferase MtaB [Spirochaetaceae bacterium]|nr:tRNA (N(6)-L-threonylcarbamoyladenosine(37)-C(2))-methylthiotransferase MtaB [Spirochaetaceae bacterium]